MKERGRSKVTRTTLFVPFGLEDHIWDNEQLLNAHPAAFAFLAAVGAMHIKTHLVRIPKRKIEKPARKIMGRKWRVHYQAILETGFIIENPDDTVTVPIVIKESRLKVWKDMPPTPQRTPTNRTQPVNSESVVGEDLYDTDETNLADPFTVSEADGANNSDGVHAKRVSVGKARVKEAVRGGKPSAGAVAKTPQPKKSKNAPSWFKGETFTNASGHEISRYEEKGNRYCHTCEFLIPAVEVNYHGAFDYNYVSSEWS